jgi:1,4-dihydroxy-2-naphthoyl-CoA hydrolase
MRSHEEQVTIPFGDADPAGVIFYPRTLALAHHAVENLIRHSPLGWEKWFASPTHAAPIRHAEAEFLRPLAVGETFTLRAIVDKIGETSVTFSADFINAAGQVAARVRTVHVLVDKTSGQPTPLTKEMRHAFEG